MLRAILEECRCPNPFPLYPPGNLNKQVIQPSDAQPIVIIENVQIQGVLKNHGFWLATRHVLIQNLRIETGDAYVVDRSMSLSMKEGRNRPAGGSCGLPHPCPPSISGGLRTRHRPPPREVPGGCRLRLL